MKSRRPQQKTRREVRRGRRRYIITILLLLFLIIDFCWIMNHPQFKVTTIEIEGNKTILSMDIQQTVREYLDTKILWILPRDTVFLTNTHSIERAVNKKYPRIYNVETIIKKGTEVLVTVEEREPHSLWCKNENYESDFDEECFFADQKGYIYTKAPYFSEGVFEKIYTSGEILTIGQQVAGGEDFEEFFGFVDLLNENSTRSYNIGSGETVTYTDTEDSDVLKRLRFGVSSLLYENTWSSFTVAAGLYQGSYTAGFSLTASILQIGFTTYEEQLGPQFNDQSDRRYSINAGLVW